MAGDKRRWTESFHKFLSSKTVSEQKSRTDVNVILDQLNSEEYTANLISNQNDILEFFNRGCLLIPINQSNGFLLSKYFQLVEKILVKQKINLDDTTLNSLIKHVVASARTCPSISVYDHLKLLGELVYENGGRCAKFHEDLLGVEPTGLLLEFTDSKNADIETQKAAITCIGNLCIKDLNGSFVVERYGEIGLLTILNVLQTPPRKEVIKIEHCKLITTALKAIQDILPSTKSPLKRHLGQLLLTMKNYIFYGFPGYELSFPNHAAGSSPHDSSSDIEPDDLSILKVSLTPVKERAFPGRGALKKKSRQKRGKRQKEDKNEEQFYEDPVLRKNDCTFQVNHSTEMPKQPLVSQGLQKTGGENDKMNDTAGVDEVTSGRATGASQELPPGQVDNTAWTRPSSSESEFSDSESGQARRFRSAAAKVRNSSLVCLQSVIKHSDKKDLFGFWSSFISDGSGALAWSLFTIIQSDPNSKNRTGAASVLMDLLDGSKPFLTAADDSEQHQTTSLRPFTSFSSRLGSIIHELHRLLDVIATETSSSAQAQLVKCMAILVLNCPYHKLQQGLLSKVVETMRPLLSCDDLVVKQSSLVCLGAVLTVDAPMNEVLQCMENTRQLSTKNVTAQLGSSSSLTENRMKQPVVESETGAKPSEQSFPWLVRDCFQILRSSSAISSNEVPSEAVIALQCEVLHVLIVFTRNYFTILRPVLLELAEVARECLREASAVLCVSAIKLLQELGRTMYQVVYTGEDEGQKTVVREFWLRLLDGEMLKILQSKDPSRNKCKAAACDCLSDIGDNVLQDLPFDKRILIMTILLGLANDQDTYVKAASIRALGVYILYPFLREDVLFVADTATAVLNGLNDSTLLVRIRAAWSLANLSDAIVMNKNSEDSTFVDDFSEMLLLHLINVSIKASQDNEKVKCNVVRTLGNLAKYLTSASIEKPTFSEAVDSIVEVLTKCIIAGQMKTRWNACYAAGNVLSNLFLPIGETSSSIGMFNALLSVVSTCKNFKVVHYSFVIVDCRDRYFARCNEEQTTSILSILQTSVGEMKVRINAVNALAVPHTRSCYGDENQFAKLWSCLIETLAGTKNISDFSEFKYRDTLSQQITATLCHISSLITPRDMEFLRPTIALHQQVLTQHLTNYYHNQLKIDENCRDNLQEEPHPAQLTDEPKSKLFLHAYNHVAAIKQEDAVETIQTVFEQAKQAAEEHFC